MNLTVIPIVQSRSMQLIPVLAPRSRSLWRIFLSLGQTEERYQEGLNKCYELRVKKETVPIRVEHEPENIADCNALEFEVLADGKWFILGYCGVKKIPKLKKALHHGQVMSIELCKLKRVWYSVISEFRFSGGLNIVKKGSWEKDDPHDVYNSVIDINIRRS